MGRLIPFILLLLLVVGVFIGVPLLVSSPKYRDLMAQHIQEKTQHPVQIEKMEASFFPPSIRLRDVTLFNRAKSSPILKAQKLNIVLDLVPLLKLSVVPKTLVVKGWEAWIFRKEDGSWDWEEWFPPASGNSGTMWPIHGVEWQEGVFHWTDPFGIILPELVMRSVEGAWQRDAKEIKWKSVLVTNERSVDVQGEAKGQFFGEPEWKGTLSLQDSGKTWQLDVARLGKDLQLKGQSKEWDWASLSTLIRFYTRWAMNPAGETSFTIQDWSQTIDSKSGHATFSQTGTVSGGPCELKGLILPVAGGPILTVEYGFKGVVIQPVVSGVLHTQNWTGTASGVGQFKVAFSTTAWQTLQGNGAFEISEGAYHWPASVSKSVGKAHLTRYVQTKYPQLLTEGPNFKLIRGQWTAKQGQITLDEGYADLGAIKLGVVGMYDAEREGLDGFVRLQIQEQDPQLIRLIPSGYVYRGGGKTILQPFHGRFTGRWDEVSLRFNRQRNIPALTLRKLKKSLENPTKK